MAGERDASVSICVAGRADVQQADDGEARPDWSYPPPPAMTATDLVLGDFWPRLFRPAMHLGLRALLGMAFELRIEHRQAIPDCGPFVIVANHASHVDTPALMAALPLHRVNDTHPLAADDYFFRRR
jgi:hypothetical protein